MCLKKQYKSEKSELSDMISSPLRYGCPFHLLWGNISKGNACVARDALCPMTPYLGRGCATLQDGVVLAEALLGKTDEEEKVENNANKEALRKDAKEGWKSFELISLYLGLYTTKQ